MFQPVISEQVQEKSVICLDSTRDSAMSILPDDRDINDYYHKVNELRAKKQKTLPVILKNERRINLFLRVNDVDLIDKINKETKLQHSVARFAWLRSKKDEF